MELNKKSAYKSIIIDDKNKGFQFDYTTKKLSKDQEMVNISIP